MGNVTVGDDTLIDALMQASTPQELRDVLSSVARDGSDVEVAAFRAALGLGTAALKNVGAASGDLVELGAGGLVPSARLPTMVFTEVVEVADEAARLALTSAAAEGKIVVQIDTGRVYGLPTGSDPTVDGNWLNFGDRKILSADIEDAADDHVAPANHGKVVKSLPSGQIAGAGLRAGDAANFGTVIIGDGVGGWSVLQPGSDGTPGMVHTLPATAGTLETEDGAQAKADAATQANIAGAAAIDDVAADDEFAVNDASAAGAQLRATANQIWGFVKSNLDSALILAGAKTFTGQLELTNQSADSDDSAMTRGLSEELTIFQTNIQTYPAFDVHNSGTGSVGDANSVGLGYPRLFPGSDSSGYAAALFSTQIHGGNWGGGGIKYNKRFKISGGLNFNIASSDVDGVYRLYTGISSDLATLNADNKLQTSDRNMFQKAGAAGVGLEFSYDTTNGSMVKLTYWDGTTYKTSSYQFNGSPPRSGEYYSYLLHNHGDGNIDFYISPASTKDGMQSLVGSSPVISVADGPTGQSEQFNSSVVWQVTNTSGAVTAGARNIYPTPITIDTNQ